MRVALVLLIASAACSRTTSIYAPTPWAEDRVSVVTILDDAGRPVTRAPFVTTADRLEVELPDEASVVHVETFARELEGCGAQFEPLQSPYPAPLEAFVATVEGDALAFTPRSAPRPAPVYFEKACDIDPPVCDRTEIVSRFLDLPGLDLLTVARIDDDTLLYGATQQTAGRILIDGVPERFADILGSQVVDTVVDGADRQIVATLRGSIVTFDAAGVLASRADIDGIRAPRMWLESDGALLVTSDAGVYSLARGSTVAVERTDFPLRTIEYVETPFGRFVLAGETVQREEGGDWTLELTDGSITPDAHLVPYDGGLALIAPDLVFLRASDGTWRSIGSPFESLVMSNGIVSRGLLVVFGDSGGFAMTRLDTIEWCRLEAGLISNFWDAVASSDGRTVYVVGSNSAGASPPAFSTIALPEL